MENMQDLEHDLNQEDPEFGMIEGEELQHQLEVNSQRMIELQQHQLQANPEGDNLQCKPVKNPVSSYMMFVSSWKQKNPDEKFNMSALGQLWKNMTLAERQPFETEYKQRRKQYEEYLAALYLQNPNGVPKDAGLKSVFPLQRIRAIMRQDQYYAPKTQSYVGMSKATECFADFLLQEIKRMSEGKSRIDHTLLYDCINNTRSLSFLECLIEQHNRQNGDPRGKKIKPEVRLQMEFNERSFQKVNSHNPERLTKPVQKKPPQPKIAYGQTSLDFFVSKQT